MTSAAMPARLSVYGPMELRVRASLAVALVCLGVIGMISWFNLARLRDDALAVAHTHRVMLHAELLLAATTEVETSQRGYVITGAENYLEPYWRALTNGGAELHTLRTLVADNPAQIQRVEKLAQLVADWLAAAGEVVAERQAQGFEAARTKLLSGRGKNLQDQIRALTDTIQGAEENLLAQREQIVERGTRRTKLVILIGSLLAFGFALLALLLLRREVAVRERAERELRAAHDQLELRVQERVAELARVNQSLQESQAQFAAVVENLGEGLIIANQSGGLVHWNPAALRLHGFVSAEEGKRLWPKFPKIFAVSTLDGSAVAAEQWPLARILRGETLRDLELRIARRDKEWARIFCISGALVRYAGNDALAFVSFNDITARNQAVETRDRLAEIVNSSDDAIITKTLEGIITSWNCGAEKIYGYTTPEVVGQSMLMLIPPGRRDEEPEILAQIGRGQNVEHFETVRRHKSGREIHISATISPLKDSAGRIIGASKIARDITERRLAQIALEQKEAQLRALDARLAQIVQGMNEACYAVDAQWRFIFVNDRIETLLKHRRDELLGKSIWEVFHKLVGTPTEKSYRRAMAERVPVAFEVFSPIAERWLDIRVFPSGDGLAAFLLDIHERKQVEAKLVDSEQRFRTMANSIPQLAWIARPDGFLTWYNQRWYDYTGTTLAEMEGSGWQRVHDPAILSEVIAQWTQSIQAGESFEMEFPLRGVDGNFRKFLTRALPLKDASGQVVQWFGTNTDVDELKRAEDEIRRLNSDLERRVIERTAQLETANKELEAFSYSVSHDLRAPLRAVNGFAGIVLEDYRALLPEEAQRYLERIRSGGQRMGELIDDLLDFSRLSRQPLNPQTVDHAELVHDVLGDLKPTWAGREVEWRNGRLPTSPGDPALVKQVWFNLLSNAIKYSRGRTPAIIETGSQIQAGETVFFVRDNGAGFDMKYVHKLFGVFQRLHRVDEFEGTGVGLAIVQRIVHRHGGRAWAEAAENRGATFYFTLNGKNNHE